MGGYEVTPAVYTQTFSELFGWVVILLVSLLMTLVSSRLAKVRRDRAKRVQR